MSSRVSCVSGQHRRPRQWLLAVALSSMAPSVRAEEPQPTGRPWVFVWDAEFPECPAQRDVEAQIPSLGDPEQIRANGVTSVALVRPRGDKWLLRLYSVTPGEVRERTMEVDDCLQAGEAAALLIALTLKPEGTQDGAQSGSELAQRVERTPAVVAELSPEAAALLRRAEQETPPVAPEPAAPSFAFKADPVADDRTRETSRGRASEQDGYWLTVSSEGGITYGEDPSARPLLRLGASLQNDWGSLGALVGGKPRSRIDLDGHGGSVDVLSVLLGVRGCRDFDDGSWRVPLCVGVDANVLRAEGQGLEAASTEHTWWIGSVVALHPRFAVTRGVYLGASFELAVPWFRPSVSVEGAGAVFRPDVVARRALGALEVQL